jgi:seryl-tRNA synthetase
MIDLQDLRDRPDAYQEAADRKRIKINIAHVIGVDSKRRELTKQVEDMRAEKNLQSKKVPELKGGEKAAVLATMKELSAELKTKEEELAAIEKDWQRHLLDLPAIPHPSVPVGADESENVEAYAKGDVPTFDFPIKDHVELGESLGILDIPRGVKVAGARSYVLKGDGALLHQAVLRFTIDALVKKGWTLFTPPMLARYDCFMGTGFFPGPDQSNIYAVGGQETPESPIDPENLYLIGTSEVTVASYHMDEVLHLGDLPTRYAGYSPCFRREAGTYGKDTKGIYRIHQFEKVEQVVLCEADADKAMHLFEDIRTNAEEVLQALHLPYRVLTICTGDLSKGKVFQQDIETWMPSRESYGETHSCSYLGDFQARRLNIKYEDVDGSKKFVHTLNNTAIASPRILIPLLELNQQKDGSVVIPEPLRGYMGGNEIVEPIY